MAWENAQIDLDEVLDRLKSQVPEIEKLEKQVPAVHHATLKETTLRRALRLYGDKPEVLAEELRLVRACIPKGETDFETLLEGAFVEVPEGFVYKPRMGVVHLESRMSANPLSRNAYGVHAVNLAELEQYFRHGGVFPHYRDGKWRIEVIPYPRCFVNMDKADKPVTIDGHSSRESYQRDQRYVDQHGFTGYLASVGAIKHLRDDHFGRLKFEQADELYNACVKHFLENDGNSHRGLRDTLAEHLGEQVGSALFREAMKAKGVRIEFNDHMRRYFEASGSDSGSIVLDQNCVLPLDAVYSIKFSSHRHAREFRKLLAQPTPPKSIFRMYLK
jgi:hypothetical protein